jgi:alkylhydroperoxidase/carboxymuconolactone decarboxylase family protein YurZ
MASREELHRQGEATRQRLFGAASAQEPSGFGTLLTEAVHGAIWNRPGLAMPERMLCTLAALAVWPRLRQLRRHIGAALDLGLSTEAVREVLLQAGLYAGFSAAEETLALMAEVLAERNVPFPPDPPAQASLDELANRGHSVMQDVHGERSRQGYAAPDNPVTYALYELAIQYGYGEIWFRPASSVASARWSRLPRSPHSACPSRQCASVRRRCASAHRAPRSSKRSCRPRRTAASHRR